MKLSEGALAALQQVINREEDSVISITSERTLVRLGLIHPTFSTVTFKGQVTAALNGHVPSPTEWVVAEAALMLSEVTR